MGFVDWFQKFCSDKGLGKLQPAIDGDATDGPTLQKEIVMGEGNEEIVIKFSVAAQEVGVLLRLECVIAAIPFNPFRRMAFLEQRLRLNTPHETGISGYLTLRGTDILFVSLWRERGTASFSERDAAAHLSSYTARARRYRKIFYDYTRQQLRDAGEEDILALERGGSEKPNIGALKL